MAAEQPIRLVLPLLMVAKEMILTQAQPLLEPKVSTVDLEVKDLDNLLLAAAVAELAQLAKINPQDQQLVVSEELEKLLPLVEPVQLAAVAAEEKDLLPEEPEDLAAVVKDLNLHRVQVVVELDKPILVVAAEDRIPLAVAKREEVAS